jgi:hypothetical protein
MNVQDTASVFSFEAAAELFPCRAKRGTRSLSYRRFDSAAEAVRFAIEDLPGTLLFGAYLEVCDERFDSEGIRKLYDRADFPLRRQTRSAERAREG